jgi:pimeloyl-ACP methyl ester carboxylesterase
MPQDALRNAVYMRIHTPLLYVRGDADGRAIEPYLNGLRRAGTENLESRVVANAGELLPIEPPQAFVDLIREFAERRLTPVGSKRA